MIKILIRQNRWDPNNEGEVFTWEQFFELALNQNDDHYGEDIDHLRRKVDAIPKIFAAIMEVIGGLPDVEVDALEQVVYQEVSFHNDMKGRKK